VAALTGGGFVIAWQGSDGAGAGVFMKRYATATATTGTEIRANTTTAGDQAAPSLAGLKDNMYVVVWQAPDGSQRGIRGQRYNATGAKAGAEFLVNTTTANDQSQPTVTGFATGGFVVGWASNGQDGSGLGVYAQAYNAAGAKSNVEFRVNTTTAGNQQQPVAAAFSGGNFFVAWTSSDGALEGVYGQRFSFAGL
jgi:hypothetical protein